MKPDPGQDLCPQRERALTKPHTCTATCTAARPRRPGPPQEKRGELSPRPLPTGSLGHAMGTKPTLPGGLLLAIPGNKLNTSLCQPRSGLCQGHPWEHWRHPGLLAQKRGRQSQVPGWLSDDGWVCLFVSDQPDTRSISHGYLGLLLNLRIWGQQFMVPA